MGVCSPTDNKLSKHQNHQNHQNQNNQNEKITNIKFDPGKKNENKNNQKSKIKNEIYENEKNEINNNEKIKKEEIDLPKLKYRPSIYIEKKTEKNPIRRLERKGSLNPLILQNRPIVRNETKKLTKQRRQSVKYINDFKKDNNLHNKNYLIQHLLRSLSKNDNNKNDFSNNNKADIPEYMIDYKLIKNENSETYYWKNMGLIKINEDLINDIMKMSIDEAKNCEFFYKKRIWLHCFLNQNVIDLKKENPVILVNRNNILEESFNQFMTSKINLKQILKIQFIDEAKHDECGVFREWYTCLFKEFFDIKNKLFIQNNDSIYKGTFIINQFCDKSKYDYYEFFGKLLVKTIIDKVHMKEHLNLTLIKYILNNKVELEDMKFFDLSIYQSLKKILDEDIDNNKDLNKINFTYNLQDEKGNIKNIEMIEEGNYIYLNNNNKNTFIEKMIYYETYYKFKNQIEKIKKGFYNIVNDIMGKFYTPQEFDFQLVGMKIIDLKDWEKNTIYKGKYNKDNKTIKLFWEVLNKLEQNELMIFFQFCTGMYNIPIDGFGNLKGKDNKIHKFTIEPLLNELYLNNNPNEFRLIEAKTCFNRILLPEYHNKEEMEKGIRIIIEYDTQYFGIIN